MPRTSRRFSGITAPKSGSCKGLHETPARPKNGSTRDPSETPVTFSLSAAAKQIGKSKTTLTRAVKSGKLSATRHEDGSYSIDPAELARAYPLQPVTRRETGSPQDPPDTPSDSELDQLRLKVEMLETMLAREQESVADLRMRLDRADSRITGLLPHTLAQPAAPRRWWRWRQTP